MTAWDGLGAGGLGLPVPPAPLLEHVRELDDDRWGTRERAPGLRGLGWYADEFESGRADDYVLAGRADAAINLPVTLYLLVYGNLGLFVEADAREDSTRGTLDAAAQLQGAFIQAAADGRIGPHKLLVVHSDLGSRRWGFYADPPEGGLDGIKGALDWLSYLPA
jgi:hypothetical protein